MILKNTSNLNKYIEVIPTCQTIIKNINMSMSLPTTR